MSLSMNDTEETNSTTDDSTAEPAPKKKTTRKKTTRKTTKKTPKKTTRKTKEDDVAKKDKKENKTVENETVKSPEEELLDSLEDLLGAAGGGGSGKKLSYYMMPSAAGGASSSSSDLRAVTMIGNLTEDRGAEVMKGMIYLYETSKEQYYEDPMDPKSKILTRRKPFDFYISTYGGSALDMCGIYDMMKFCQSQGCDIETIGMGKIMSAGVPLLAAGTKGKRCIGKNAVVMIHGVQGGAMGSLAETKNELEQIGKIQDKYVELLAANTKLTAKKIEKMIAKNVNVYLTAEEAKAAGIVDIILDD